MYPSVYLPREMKDQGMDWAGVLSEFWPKHCCIIHPALERADLPIWNTTIHVRCEWVYVSSHALWSTISVLASYKVIFAQNSWAGNVIPWVMVNSTVQREAANTCETLSITSTSAVRPAIVKTQQKSLVHVFNWSCRIVKVGANANGLMIIHVHAKP